MGSLGSGPPPEDFFQQADDPDFFDKIPEQGIHHSPSGEHKHKEGGAGEAANHTAEHDHDHEHEVRVGARGATLHCTVVLRFTTFILGLSTLTNLYKAI